MKLYKYLSLIVLATLGFTAAASGEGYMTFYIEMNAAEYLQPVPKKSLNDYCKEKRLKRAVHSEVNGQTRTIVCKGDERKIHALRIRQQAEYLPPDELEGDEREAMAPSYNPDAQISLGAPAAR